MTKQIAQGAEATIELNKNIITKERIPKSYRIKEIDEKIRKQRTRAETKLLKKARKIILVPKVKNMNEKTFEIEMEYIEGKKLANHLNTLPKKEQIKICKKIGTTVSKLHKKNIIHGDLTTSNMILKNKKIYLIDFGLGYQNGKYEDKAVDIHLFKQALEAKHFKFWQDLYKAFKEGYLSIENSEKKKVLERLKAVEKRGRYKH